MFTRYRPKARVVIQASCCCVMVPGAKASSFRDDCQLREASPRHLARQEGKRPHDPDVLGEGGREGRGVRGQEGAQAGYASCTGHDQRARERDDCGQTPRPQRARRKQRRRRLQPPPSTVAHHKTKQQKTSLNHGLTAQCAQPTKQTDQFGASRVTCWSSDRAECSDRGHQIKLTEVILDSVQWWSFFLWCCFPPTPFRVELLFFFLLVVLPSPPFFLVVLVPEKKAAPAHGEEGGKQHHPKEEEANQHHPTGERENAAPPKGGEQGTQPHPQGKRGTAALAGESSTIERRRRKASPPKRERR